MSLLSCRLSIAGPGHAHCHRARPRIQRSTSGRLVAAFAAIAAFDATSVWAAYSAYQPCFAPITVSAIATIDSNRYS